jgi:hypothetical protein
MKNLKTFEKYFTIEKTPLINKVVEDENGWVVAKIDMSKAMSDDFEAKFDNQWSPKNIENDFFAIEVGDASGLEELRIFLSTYLGKSAYTIVEEYFYDFEEEAFENVEEDEFYNEEDLDNDIAEGIDADKLLDDLKANFRSWETDCDNAECFEKLTKIISERHPNIEPDTIAEVCANWIGYSLTNESLNEAVTDEDMLALHDQVKGANATLKDASDEIKKYLKGKNSGSLSYKYAKKVESNIDKATASLDIAMQYTRKIK